MLHGASSLREIRTGENAKGRSAALTKMAVERVCNARPREMDSNAWNRAAQPQPRCFLLFRASRRPPKPMNDRPKGIKSRVQRAAGMGRTPSIRPLRDAYADSPSLVEGSDADPV